MVSLGQLRRWTHTRVPVPEEWWNKTFIVVRERPHLIRRDGSKLSSWDIFIDGQVDTHWHESNLDQMSEVIDESG